MAENKPVTPAFLFAAMLWLPLIQQAKALQAEKMSPIQSIQEASMESLNEQSKAIALPKRFRLPIREIWSGQFRLEKRQGRRAAWFLEQPRFRAAYDFLLLRQQAGEAGLEEICEWWTLFQTVDAHKRKQMCNDLQQSRYKMIKRES